MALQLQKQGETVGMLAMFDTCRPGYSKRASFLQRIPIHLHNIFHKVTRLLPTQTDRLE